MEIQNCYVVPCLDIEGEGIDCYFGPFLNLVEACGFVRRFNNDEDCEVMAMKPVEYDPEIHTNLIDIR